MFNTLTLQSELTSVEDGQLNNVSLFITSTVMVVILRVNDEWQKRWGCVSASVKNDKKVTFFIDNSMKPTAHSFDSDHTLYIGQ